MNSDYSWPKLVTIVGLNYLFIPKNIYILYLFAHCFFFFFLKNCLVILQLFYLLKNRGIIEICKNK
jgi:hypothetical protein